MSYPPQRPLWRVYLVFLVPMVLSNILQGLSGTLNGIYIGQMLGTHALAAVSGMFPIVFFFISLVIGIGAGAGQHISPDGDDHFGAFRPVAGGQICQRATFGQREMRAAEGHKINLLRPEVQFSPNAGKVGAGDGDNVGRFGEVCRLGRVARDMQHRCGRSGAEGRAHRLEIVVRRGGRLQPGQEGDAVWRKLTRDIAQNWPKCVIMARRKFDLYTAARGTVGGQIDARQRRAPGHRDEEITIVKYILADPAFLAEVQTVVREMVILIAADAVTNVDHVQGAGAPGFHERVSEYAKRAGESALEPTSPRFQ